MNTRMFIFFKIYYLSLSYKIKPVSFHPPVFTPSFVGHYHVTCAVLDTFWKVSELTCIHLGSFQINTYRPLSKKFRVAAPLRHPLQIRYGVANRSLLAATPRPAIQDALPLNVICFYCICISVYPVCNYHLYIHLSAVNLW